MSGRDSTRRGQWAEEAAAAFLQKSGYRVVARNYRAQRGEVDLICRHGAALVFVEVRYRLHPGEAIASVDLHKARRIAMTARHYLACQVRGPLPLCRFDVVTVHGTPDHPVIEVVENAFDLGDL